MQPRQELNQMRTVSLAQDSFTELLVGLAEKSATLVREEVLLARQEMQETWRETKPALILLGIGISGVMLAAMSLVAAVILGLSQYLAPWLAALVGGGALALLASYILIKGWHQLNKLDSHPHKQLPR